MKIKMLPDRLTKEEFHYFMLSQAEKGSVVGFADKPDDAVDLFSNCNGRPCGILCEDVVDIDLTRYHLNFSQKQKGSRVTIMKSGNLVLQFDKRIRLPHSQPIYVDQKNNRLTWKALSYPVGGTLSKQDRDGFCKLWINFL